MPWAAPAVGFGLLAQAYATLSVPAKRAAYDREQGAARSRPNPTPPPQPAPDPSLRLLAAALRAAKRTVATGALEAAVADEFAELVFFGAVEPQPAAPAQVARRVFRPSELLVTAAYTALGQYHAQQQQAHLGDWSVRAKLGYQLALLTDLCPGNTRRSRRGRCSRAGRWLAGKRAGCRDPG